MEGSTALAEWRKTRRQNVPDFIKRFYEKVAASLTGGTPPNDYTEGDLVVEVGDDLIPIEVKGQGDSQAFRVEWLQLQSHKKTISMFPYSGYFYYMIFGYTGRESRTVRPNHSRRRIARERIASGRGYEFLSRRTNCLWVIPIQLMEDFRKALGLRYGAFPDPSTVVLKIGKDFLADFANNGNGSNDGWRSRSGEVRERFGVNGNRVRMRFPVTTFVHEDYPEIPLIRGVQWEEASS